MLPLPIPIPAWGQMTLCAFTVLIWPSPALMLQVCALPLDPCCRF